MPNFSRSFGVGKLDQILVTLVDLANGTWLRITSPKSRVSEIDSRQGRGVVSHQADIGRLVSMILGMDKRYLSKT